MFWICGWEMETTLFDIYLVARGMWAFLPTIQNNMKTAFWPYRIFCHSFHQMINRRALCDREFEEFEFTNRARSQHFT